MQPDAFYAALFPYSPYRDQPIDNGPYRYAWLRAGVPDICTLVLNDYQGIWRQATARRTRVARTASLPRALVSWAREALRETRAHGPAAQREYGRSVSRQWRDLWSVYCKAAVTPPEYYSGHLARHAGGPELQNYVGYGMLARVLVDLQRRALGLPDFLLNDKLAFSEWCGDHDVACPSQFVLQPDSDWQAAQLVSLGKRLVIKPRAAFGGAGIQFWERRGENAWYFEQQVYTTAQFEQRLSELARKWPPGILVQPHLENDTRLPYHGPVLATCRVVSMLNESRQPEIIHVYQRLVHDPAATVDNYTVGGSFWLVDNFDQGTIAYGGSKASKTLQKLLQDDPHYADFGVGKPLVAWRSIADFALATHAKAPRTLAVAWDIALTADGPVMIEANFPPSLGTLWQYSCNGFANSRAARLFLHWLNDQNHGVAQW